MMPHFDVSCVELDFRQDAILKNGESNCTWRPGDARFSWKNEVPFSMDNEELDDSLVCPFPCHRHLWLLISFLKTLKILGDRVSTP